MTNRGISDDLLVRECLSGSQEAWNNFYRRFAGLIKTVIRRHLPYARDDVADVTQDVLVALMSGMHTYDSAHPLHRFVALVAERVCVDEYRAASAQKRQAETEPIDHHDAGPDAGRVVPSEIDPPDELVSKAESIQCLRDSFRRLGQRCRELINLRYYQELSYREMVEILGGTENRLAVQIRRCLEELRICYREWSGAEL
jgi:RNA polymerase sigma factor (sigma-70 family)